MDERKRKLIVLYCLALAFMSVTSDGYPVNSSEAEKKSYRPSYELCERLLRNTSYKMWYNVCASFYVRSAPKNTRRSSDGDADKWRKEIFNHVSHGGGDLEQEESNYQIFLV